MDPSGPDRIVSGLADFARDLTSVPDIAAILERAAEAVLALTNAASAVAAAETDHGPPDTRMLVIAGSSGRRFGTLQVTGSDESDRATLDAISAIASAAAIGADDAQRGERARARYQALAESDLVGIVIHDGQRVVSASAGALRIAGIPTPPEAPAASPQTSTDAADAEWDFVAPDGTPIEEDDLPAVRTVRTGRPSQRLLGLREHRTGHRRWILATASPTGTGEAVVVLLDVTEGFQAQRLQDAHHQILVGMASGEDLKVTLERICSSLQTLTEGSGAAVILREPGAARVGATSHGDVSAVTDQVDATDEDWEALEDLASRLGLPSAWAAPIRGEGGSVVGAIVGPEPRVAPGTAAIFDALTTFTSLAGIAIARERFESELRTSRAEARSTSSHLSALIDAAPVAIIQTDLDGRVETWNRAAERIFGWTGSEVEGRVLADLAPGRDDAISRLWAGLRDGGFPEQPLETQRTRKDGTTIDVSVVVAPIRDETGSLRSVLALVDDVTGRHELEEQVLRSQRMEAMGRLAGAIAHDFNNVLTAILGHAEFLTEVVDNEARLDVEMIEAAARHGAALTGQLLTVGKRQRRHPVPVDLRRHIEALAPTLRRLLGETVDLRTESRSVPPVLADPVQIEQVVLNLAINARDAMRNGGRLVIGVDTAETEHGSRVRLTVSDTGEGMDEDTAARAFDPFFTTKGPEEGTGLGLAAVFAIVDQSGGTIALDTAPGEGTTITIDLPATSAPLPSTANGPASADVGTSLPGARILLVEDEPSVRDLARAVLERQGHTVIEARDGDEAIGLIESDQALDVLVSDVVLPRASGFDVARRAREVRPGLAILLMSGFVDRDAAVGHGLGGNASLLRKPFLPADLTARVADLWGGPAEEDPA